MRKVGIHMLTNQMVLAKSVYHAGRLLIKEGNQELEKYKDSLLQIGITCVYIEDENSEGIVIQDVISDELRSEAKSKLGEVIDQYKKRDVLNIDSLSRVVREIVDEIYLAPDAALSLSDISSKDDALVYHSVSTAVYAALIGKSLGYDKAFLEKLVYGAILHDIGVAKLDNKLFMKRGAWDKSEMAEYQKHTQIGYADLKKANEITELSKIVALSHHERLDGSGYPEHKKEAAIHEIVRIVSIADEFDNLITGSGEYREEKYTVIDAMEKLMADSASGLDATLAAHLMNRIALYPNGCMVKLSDNSYGLIKEQNQHMPYRPIVRIIADEKGNKIKQREVDLVSELSLTIIQSEMEKNVQSA